MEDATTAYTGPTNRRRFGYGVAIAVNAGLLLVVNNLLAWDWFPWLTAEFEQVLPIINLSLAASITVNVAYLAYDAPWFKSMCEFGLLVISLLAAIRMLQVFPFDFSAYAWNWDALAQAILILGIVGVGIAMVVQLVQLVRAVAAAALPRQPSHRPPDA